MGLMGLIGRMGARRCFSFALYVGRVWLLAFGYE
jgi:hypothetical protein